MADKTRKAPVEVKLTAILVFFITIFVLSTPCISASDPDTAIHPQTPTQHQPEESFDNHDDHIWTEIGIYGFLVGIYGDARIGDVTVDVDISFSDLLDMLDMGAMFYVDHRRGNWSFIVDLAYLDISDDKAIALNRFLSVELDVEFQQLLVEGFVGYRVFDRDYGKSRLGIDVLGGARYNHFEVDLDTRASLLGLTTSASRNKKKDMLDGVIGGRVQYGQDRGWAVSGWADIGEGSDSNSYQLFGMLSYKFENNIRVVAGYRYYHLKYDKGSGASRRGIDLDYKGPVLGVSYTF